MELEMLKQEWSNLDARLSKIEEKPDPSDKKEETEGTEEKPDNDVDNSQENVNTDVIVEEENNEPVSEPVNEQNLEVGEP